MKKNMHPQTIGILSFWENPNFGSFLQSYALCKTISKIHPNYDVRDIAYANKKHHEVYYSIIRKSYFKCWAVNPLFYLDIIKRVKNRKQIYNLRRFKQHYHKYINHTNSYTKDSLQNTKFDTLVLGSDIIWDYSIRFYDRDPLLFGKGINADKKVSYAASFGTVKREVEHPKYVIDAINQIDYITVRDNNSSMIVEDITGVKASVVLDPTLLWDFKSDDNIATSDFKHKYVVVYGSFFTTEQINGLKAFCKNNNYKIVFLDSGLDSCDWCDIFIDASSITPFEWCAYIRDAELLLTCTFHGFLFGLIFEKRIVFNATNFMKAKLADFLKDLGLYDVLINDNTFDGQIKYSWDYSSINRVLANLREESLQFLSENI